MKYFIWEFLNDTDGGLGVEAFQKTMKVQRSSRQAQGRIENTVRTMAAAETLDGHAHDVAIRLGDTA